MPLCRIAFTQGDAVLLLEDGVFLGLGELPFPAYAISADVRARGLQTRLGADIDVIDYAGFVELTTQASKVCAWF